MDLAIHIILGLCLVVGALCIFLANLLMKEMNEVINKLHDKIELVSANNRALMDTLKSQTDAKLGLQKAIYAKLAEDLKQRHIHVVDDEKPLDFPNGD